MKGLADPCPEILLTRRRVGHVADARRHGRRAAALLQRAQGRGAVPHAGGAVSRPHRSRRGSRARLRHGHVAGAVPGCVLRHQPVPGARAGDGRIPRRRAAGGSPLWTREGDAGGARFAGGVAARFVRLQRDARLAPRPALLVRAFHQRPRRRRGDARLSSRLPPFRPANRRPIPCSPCSRSAAARPRRPSDWPHPSTCAGCRWHAGFDAPVATIEQALGPAVHRSRPHGHPPGTRAGDHRHARVGSRSHSRIAVAVRSRRSDGAHDHRRLRRTHRVLCDAGGGFRVCRVPTT